MQSWRWGAEQKSPCAGGKAGLTPDDRGNQRQKKELPVSLCCSYTRHNLPPDCQLVLLPPAKRAGSSTLGLCCGQIEIPALKSCHPNSRAWLHKHHHRLDMLGKQGVTARTYPTPGTAQSVPHWEKSSAEQGEHLNASLGLHLHI